MPPLEKTNLKASHTALMTSRRASERCVGWAVPTVFSDELKMVGIAHPTNTGRKRHCRDCTTTLQPRQLEFKFDASGQSLADRDLFGGKLGQQLLDEQNRFFNLIGLDENQITGRHLSKRHFDRSHLAPCFNDVRRLQSFA